MLQTPGLVNQFSATPRGHLNWTGPIANGSEFFFRRREPLESLESLDSLENNCDIVGLLQESKRPLPKKLRKKSEKGFPGQISIPAGDLEFFQSLGP